MPEHGDSAPVSPATEPEQGTDSPASLTSEPAASAASSLIQARNQLRSRMKRQTSQSESGVKKARQTPAKSDALSVLDRVATAAETASPVSGATSAAVSSNPVPAQGSDTSHTASEPYQWRPSQLKPRHPCCTFVDAKRAQTGT
ncbi:hypothetical protein [Salinivibrio socompensis]|uniref:hypothetical protein n=1 Tax=Salinivibrio socompensis TaxID=1510206 RepID=UPI00055ED57B